MPRLGILSQGATKTAFIQKTIVHWVNHMALKQGPRRLRVAAIIPARMGSSRFPGKPLAPILGRPMIEHMYRRTAMSSVLDAVYIATCDREIFEVVEGFGGRAIMTSASHERASDRVAEAARDMDVDVVVMAQGDEPMLTPEMIDLAVAPILEHDDVLCVNLVKRIETVEEFLDHNTIKVVMDHKGDALFFSRESIPTMSPAGFDGIRAYKQVCIIPFRRDFLLAYADLEPTALEKAESIDMLRALEHGYSIRLVETPYTTFAVDTPSDLARVERLMQQDELVSRYI